MRFSPVVCSKGWEVVGGFRGSRRAACQAGITHCCPCTSPQGFPAGKVTAKQVPVLFKYPRVETDLEMIPVFIPHNFFFASLGSGSQTSIPSPGSQPRISLQALIPSLWILSREISLVSLTLVSQKGENNSWEQMGNAITTERSA